MINGYFMVSLEKRQFITAVSFRETVLRVRHAAIFRFCQFWLFGFFEFLRQVLIYNVCQTVPAERLLLCLALYLHERFDFPSPQWVFVSWVFLQLVQSFHVHFIKWVSGQLVVHDVRSPHSAPLCIGSVQFP